MKRLCIPLLVFLASCASSLLHFTEVNPFIGTGGHGHTYQEPLRPLVWFNSVRTPGLRMGRLWWLPRHRRPRVRVQSHPFARHWRQRLRRHFAHACTQFQQADAWRDRCASGFRKSTESAHAGWYGVTLDDHGVDVELTTTPRVGVHRYRLQDPTDTLMLIIDMAHRDELVNYRIEPVDDRTIVGHRVSNNWAKEQHVYFAMAFDQPFVWQDQMTEVTRQDTLADGTVEQEITFVPCFGPTSGR